MSGKAIDRMDDEPDLPVEYDDDLAPESGNVVAIMGAASRKGRWSPPSRLRVFSLMGGVEIDFRDVELLDAVTEVRVYALMGGTVITVPPGVDVDATGLGLLGGFAGTSNHTGDPEAPLIRIRGWALMGNVDVKVKPAKRRLFRRS